MNLLRTCACAILFAAASTHGLTAAAARLDVKCEVRSDRSRASVDAKNVASGDYYAVLISGGEAVTS
jgi:hypothetical protein